MNRIFKASAGFLALSFALMPVAHTAAQTGAPSVSSGKRATNAARQPLDDFNITKDEIPEKLIEIQDNPYAIDGIKTCRQISQEVEELNAVLGADVDSTDEEKRKTIDAAIDVGGGLLTGIIPFRGLVREVSGANAATKRYQRALYSGISRRSFMKGMGKAKGCRPPASPKAVVATPAETPKDDKAKK